MLLGRSAERQRIEAALEGARDGHSSVLGFVGEPGIGKTALLDHAAATASGFTVLQARGVESEAHIPFGSLFELCRPALGAMASIPRPQAAALESALALRPAQRAERFAVGAGVLSWMAAVAERQPVLVLLDDVHWFDPSSGEALRFALRRLVADRVAVLLAVREGAASLLDGAELPRWRVGGLTATDAAPLLAQAGVPADLAERAVAVTGGNPLALVELGRTGGHLGLASGVPALVPVPDALARGFLRQVQRLDPESRRMLLLVAVHDGDDAVTLERAARHLNVEFAAVTRAEAAGVVTVLEGRVLFRHPLVRSAVYGSAPLDARREAHRAVAAVLSDRDVDRRAWHLASAAVGTDADAADVLRQAGERARERSAYAVAVAAFERAANLAPYETERGDLLCEAAQAAWLAGLNDRVPALLAAARTSGPPESRAMELAHLEGQIALHRGPVMEGHAVLTAAAAGADPERAVELLAAATVACFFAGLPAEMLATAQEAEARVTPLASQRARYLASLSKGMAMILGGDARRGAVTIRAAIDLVEAGGVPDDPGWVTWMVLGHVWLRDDLAARTVVDRALGAARARSAVGTLPLLLSFLARDQAGGDAWAVAAACFDESIRLSRETGQRTDLAGALAGLAWLEARRGQDELCRKHAAEALDLCRQLGMDYFTIWTMAALGDLELGRGRAEAAAGHYRRQAELLDERGITDADVSPLPELVDACLRLGRRQEAAAFAERFDAVARDKGQPWSCARAARAMGMVECDEAFEACFDEARAAHAATPDSFELARTLLAYGVRLRRARRRLDARGPLREAFERFDLLGARPWAEAARVELDATGETVHSCHVGARERLTPQELQIALLLASGRTTREAAAALFVSPKTVEYHLRHVYQKLDVRSRRALAHALEVDAIPGGASGNRAEPV